MLASGPYLPPLAFPPAPQNLRIDTLGVTVSRDMSRLLDVQNCNSCCSVVVKGRPKGPARDPMVCDWPGSVGLPFLANFGARSFLCQTFRFGTVAW